jgi:hypothetical protein
MAGKRKRSRPSHRMGGDPKRQKVSESPIGKDPVVKEALLAQFYPQVLSLREFLISKLPPSSKVRRKKILFVGKKPDSEADQKLSKVLDQTLVGVSKHKGVSQEERWQQWTTFSQKADDSVSFANATGVGIFSQSEVGSFICSLIAIVMECYGPGAETSADIIFRLLTLSYGYCLPKTVPPMDGSSIYFAKVSRKIFQHALCIVARTLPRPFQAFSQSIRTVT